MACPAMSPSYRRGHSRRSYQTLAARRGRAVSHTSAAASPISIVCSLDRASLNEVDTASLFDAVHEIPTGRLWFSFGAEALVLYFMGDRTLLDWLASLPGRKPTSGSPLTQLEPEPGLTRD